MQQTLIILKPDAVQKNVIGAVISRFEQAGFKVKNLYALKASKEILESHYETIGKLLTRTNAEIFNEVVDYMASDTIIPLLLEGENVIEAVRAMAGKTRPREAAPGTIRGDFWAKNPNGPIHNVIHASANEEEAELEIKLWFPNS